MVLTGNTFALFCANYPVNTILQEQYSTGLYHLTGLVHLSEVSWDLVQDVHDFLNEGDAVKVKVVNVDT
jgi:predicted RNA-binding protein with RPS1 domain